MAENNFFEKCVLELCRTAMIKPRQIERSVFFYWTTTDKLEFTDWFQVNRMLGCGEIAIFRPRMKKLALKLFRTATIKPRQIERSGFLLLDHNGQT